MSIEKRLIGVNPSGDKPNVEDVFSTYLYEGTGSAQTITNGIDLDGEGGLVWIKDRTVAKWHKLYDTERGVNKPLFTNETDGESTISSTLTSFNSNGFTLGAGGVGNNNSVNENNEDYASWTFRKAPKFFDVKTFIAESDQFVTVNHDLGCNIGAVMYKETSGTGDWYFWHKSFSENDIIRLNTTAAKQTGQGYISSQTSSSARFYTDANTTSTYVAYLFADNSAEDADEQMIACGSGTTDSSDEKCTITLGWEPQFVLVKRTDGNGNWEIYDSMRGFGADGEEANDKVLSANLSGSEAGAGRGGTHADGFTVRYIGSNADFIYMAIRAPMMKEPESATDVFDVTTGTLSNGSTQTTGFPIDMQISRSISNDAAVAIDRLRGTNIRTSASQARGLYTSSTSAENTNNNNSSNWDNTGFDVTGTFGNVNAVWWNFKRAKGFFDAVAYKGNGTAGRTVSHSLGVVPEMIWAKCRSNGGNAYYWQVYHVGTGNTKSLRLNESNATATIPVWNNTTPTDSVFELDNWGNTNGSGETYIAYLFASLDGISKVGSYTGSSSSVVNVDCGFSNGARFVLIKRTDSNGDWMVFDTERGIVTGNDPMLNLNNTDAEWSGGDLLDPYSSGFSVNPNWAGSTDNGTYIFYAIA